MSRIGGSLGWWIGLGQFICGDGAPVSHAFIVVGDQVVEAMPSGARLAPLANYLGRDDVYFSRMDLTEEQQHTIAGHALDLLGTPYSFAQYAALALNVWRIRPRRLLDYIASSNRLICSQLIDTVMARSGIHLFQDRRDFGAVLPGDLYRWLAINGSQRPALTTEGKSA